MGVELPFVDAAGDILEDGVSPLEDALAAFSARRFCLLAEGMMNASLAGCRGMIQ